jgi:steroid delta-isomerase
MADETTIRDTIDRYWKAFSAGDRDGWLSLFTEDATVEDPVGTPVRYGHTEIGAFFDESQSLADSIELRSMDVTNVCGDQAAFAMQIRPLIGGTAFVMEAIDVMTFADDGRISSMRAYWQPERMRPAD